MYSGARPRMKLSHKHSYCWAKPWSLTTFIAIISTVKTYVSKYKFRSIEKWAHSDMKCPWIFVLIFWHYTQWLTVSLKCLLIPNNCIVLYAWCIVLRVLANIKKWKAVFVNRHITVEAMVEVHSFLKLAFKLPFNDPKHFPFLRTFFSGNVPVVRYECTYNYNVCS